MSELAREHAPADFVTGKNHRDFLAIHRKRRGNFAADEPGANDGESVALFGQCAKTAVIGEGAEINYLVVVEREAARRAARGKQKLLIGKCVFPAVDRAPFFRN